MCMLYIFNIYIYPYFDQMEWTTSDFCLQYFNGPFKNKTSNFC